MLCVPSYVSYFQNEKKTYVTLLTTFTDMKHFIATEFSLKLNTRANDGHPDQPYNIIELHFTVPSCVELFSNDILLFLTAFSLYCKFLLL